MSSSPSRSSRRTLRAGAGTAGALDPGPFAHTPVVAACAGAAVAPAAAAAFQAKKP